MEITKNYRAIEELKVNVMLGIGELYKTMLIEPDNINAVTEGIAEIFIYIHLLEGRLGINPANTDRVAVKKLRSILGNESLREDVLRLLDYFK